MANVAIRPSRRARRRADAGLGAALGERLVEAAGTDLLLEPADPEPVDRSHAKMSANTTMPSIRVKSIVPSMVGSRRVIVAVWCSERHQSTE